MSKQVTKSANTIDSKNHAWETIGENIRMSSSGDGSSIDLKTILDILLPVGSYFVGNIPETWNTVSTWEKQGVSSAVVVSNPDAEAFSADILSGNVGEPVDTINFLLFKRTA